MLAASVCTAYAARRIKNYRALCAFAVPLTAAAGLLFVSVAAHAQTVYPEQAVFDALTRTDYNNNTYSGPGAVDFAGANVVSSVGPPPVNTLPTTFTKGRTLEGQSFSAANLGVNANGQTGFEVTKLQFYLWNGIGGAGGDGGDSTIYSGVKATVNFWNASTGDDEFTTSPGTGIFSNKIGTLTYDFTSQQVSSVNGINGAATLITITVPQPTSYVYTRYGTDANTPGPLSTFLGISISLQGDAGAGAGFGTTNDLSVAIWDKADYQQTTTGQIAMRTGTSSTGHPYGGFYRDYDVPDGDTLHQFGNFSGRDNRSSLGTSYNSLALALFGRNITVTPEPSTLALALPFLVTGGSVLWRRRQHNRKTAK